MYVVIFFGNDDRVLRVVGPFGTYVEADEYGRRYVPDAGTWIARLVLEPRGED